MDNNVVARVLGYDLGYKDFSTVSPNLPQRAVILAQIATGKESGFTDYDKRITVNSASDAYNLFGISPIYYAMRIMKPVNGGGIGSVPVDVIPVDVSAGTASTGTITPAGTATANAVHTVVFGGRNSIDGKSCQINIVKGDTVALICGKLTTAINGMLYAPVSAVNGTTDVDLTCRWKGVSGNEITITINDGGESAGIAYSFSTFTGGTATVDVTDALNAFGDVWETMVLNSFGSAIFDDLEAFNGLPNPETGGSGRWNASVMKPFVAVTGTTEDDIATLLALGSGRTDDMTNCLAVAPRSNGYSFEASANMIALMASKMNAKPHSDSADMVYPDMPAPLGDAIGDMSIYTNRNTLVLGGISTATYDDSVGYKCEDFITFRRPQNQNPLAIDFRYVRNIIGIDFNVFYTYRILEEKFLYGKTIADDGQVIAGSVSTDTIKLKDWKSIVYGMFDDLATRALIVQSAFSKESLNVTLDSQNPSRVNTIYNYKRSSTVRVGATTAFAGFNFGSN